MANGGLIGINVHRAGIRYQTGGTHIWTEIRHYLDVREVTGGSATTPFSGGSQSERVDVDWASATNKGYPGVGQVWHCYVPCFQSGSHTITWTGGASDVVFHSNSGNTGIGVATSANQIDLTNVPVDQIAYTIRVGSGVTNLSIKHVDDIASGDKYHTAAVNYYKPFTVLRWMTAGETNGTPKNNFYWDSNYDADWFTYFGPFGVPPDERVNYTNHISSVTGNPCHCWDNIHDTVLSLDDGADLADWLNVYNSLSAGNKAYIEYGNEPWNNPSGTAFQMGQRMKADALNNPDLIPYRENNSSEFRIRMMQYAIYSAQVHTQAQTTLSGGPTWEVILNSQASNNGIINWLHDAPYLTGVVGDYVKHVSIAPYIGSSGFPATNSISVLMDHLNEDYEKRWKNERQWQKTFNKTSLFEKTSIYEINDHASKSTSIIDNQQVTDLLKTHYEAILSGNNPLTTETFRGVEILAHFAADGTGSHWDTPTGSTRMTMLLDLAGSVAPPDPTPDPVNPIANAGAAQTVQPLSTATTHDVTLDGTRSTVEDPLATPGDLDYQWWVTPTTAPVPASTATPTVTLDAPGTYTFELQVTDSLGNLSAKDSVVITVQAPNVPPTADAGPDDEVTIAEGSTKYSYTFDGFRSSDSDGTIVEYNWAVDGTVYTRTTSTLTLDMSEGTRLITLAVKDDDGEWSGKDSMQLVVNQAPVTPPPPPIPVPPIVTGTWHIQDQGNLGVSPIGTYSTTGAATTAYYNKFIEGNPAGFDVLNFKLWTPDDIDNQRQIPALVWPVNKSYTASNYDNDTDGADTHCAALASMGMVVMSVQTQIETNSPMTPGDSSGDSDITKTNRAVIKNIQRAIEYLRQNPVATNYQIAQNQIFLGGVDTAGIAAMHYIQNLSGSHGLAGMILLNCAFGFGSTWPGDQAQDTTDIRAFGEESTWPQDPPVFWACGDSDTYLANVSALKVKFDADSSNTTYYATGENHTDPDTWTVGGGTVWQAVQTYVSAIVDAKPDSSSVWVIS